MRIAIALAITLGAFGVSPVVAANAEPAEPVHHYTHHHHHYHRHHVVTPAHSAPIAVAPAPETPGVQPSPPREDDGLSRDPEDCDMGCIGGNPN